VFLRNQKILNTKTDQKCRSLKEEHFIGLHDVGELAQAPLHLTHVRNQHVDDGAPGLEQKKIVLLKTVLLIKENKTFFKGNIK
jgi:hypothetical protein